MIPEVATRIPVEGLPTSEMGVPNTSLTEGAISASGKPETTLLLDVDKVASTALDGMSTTESTATEARINDDLLEKVLIQAAETASFNTNDDDLKPVVIIDVTNDILCGNEMEIAFSANVPLDTVNEISLENGNTVEHTRRTPEKRTIKLSSFTAEERLQMRAKKFGIFHENFSSEEKRKVDELDDKKEFTDMSSGEGKFIKLSTLTAEERLKMRAKKFGFSSPKGTKKLTKGNRCTSRLPLFRQ